MPPWLLCISIAYFLPLLAAVTLKHRGLDPIQVTWLHSSIAASLAGFFSCFQLSFLGTLFLLFLLLVAYTDHWGGVIPNTFTYPVFFFFCGLQCWIHPINEWMEYILTSIITLTILYTLARFTKGMGGGDVKLFAVVALVVGWPGILLALWLATMSAMVYVGIRYVICQDKLSRMPFGPHIAIGSMVTYLWGDLFWRWYLSFS